MASVLRFREDVTGAAHGYDSTRRFWVVLDGGPDARNVNVYGAVEGIKCLTLECVHQSIARHHTTGIFGQCQDQCKLMAGERPVFTVNANLMCTTVDVEAAEMQHITGRGSLTAAQDRGEARQQFPRFKGLGR